MKLEDMAAPSVATFGQDIDVFALSSLVYQQSQNKQMEMQQKNFVSLSTHHHYHHHHIASHPTVLSQQQNPQPQLQGRTRHPSWGSSSSTSSSHTGGRPSPTTISCFDAAPGSPVSVQPMELSSTRDRSSPTTVVMSQQVPQHRRLDRSISEPADRCSSQKSQNQQNVPSGRYKTELCRPFEENGYCKYGDKCQFAHGNTEQRSLSRHPYKTELCRTFHTVGFCPYGPRCHFIHSEDEHKLSQISQMKHHQAHQVVQQQVVQVQQQQAVIQQRQMSMPTAIVRQPQHTTLVPPPHNFTLSLGSTADSPSGSPTMSPVSFASDDSMQQGSSSPPPASAPADSHSCNNFPFQDFFLFAHGGANPSHPQHLLDNNNVTTTSMQAADPIASLAAGLQAARLAQVAKQNERNNMVDNGDMHPMMFNMPPSPPESLNGDTEPSIVAMVTSAPSCVDRLPIFNQLVGAVQN